MAKLQGRRLVDDAKIGGYLLNAAHPDGSPKARFFKIFGFDPDRPEELRAAIMAHPEVNHVTATWADEFGVRSVVECSISSPDGRKPCVRTVWMLSRGFEDHRFVTAYPAAPR